MHCNTVCYTVEYTAAQCSPDSKTRPNNAAGIWSGCWPPRTECTNKKKKKKYRSSIENKYKCRQ